ncbi:aminotransferase class V-fold PLP-dependent enzyme [Candidatus Electronema sp. JM]|uniref:aminotransferase class V-fold PLP-dependent enzyme n=1 Tax=Candidatus Electronema sp. JM TaxID=3401571 RepID=UPI003AA9B19B
MLYLDNAATSWPKPEQVRRAAQDWLEHGGGSPGRGTHAFARKAGDVLSLTRRSLARFFNAPHEHRIIFCASATDGLNLALKGFLNPGDHVLISAMEHNSVLRPLRGLQQERGISLDIVPCDSEGRLDPDEVARRMNDRTRLVVVSHASNVTGAVQPVAEIGRLVRERGAYLLVDAAQTAGILPIDFQTLNADLLVFSGHKGLYGLQGTGALIIGERVKSLRPWREGGTGFNSLSEEQPQEWPERFEAGTPNVPGILALGEGIAFLMAEGVDTVRAKEDALFAGLWRGLSELDGVTLHGPPPGKERIAILSFSIHGWEPEDIGGILHHNHGIQVRTGLHCAPLAHRTLGTLPLGTVRLSPGCFTTAEEIRQAVAAIRMIAETVLP